MLHVICTRLRPSHLSVRVGDSSRRSEEIVKILNCTFQCECYSYSRADSQNYCAQYEESMKSLLVSLHTISFNFRCGGKLDLTSEVSHLGFYKMAALKSLFSKSLLLIDLEF